MLLEPEWGHELDHGPKLLTQCSFAELVVAYSFVQVDSMLVGLEVSSLPLVVETQRCFGSLQLSNSLVAQP